MLAEGRDKLHDSYILTDIELPSGKYEDGQVIEEGNFRVESDSMGQVKVPAERLWDSQTQRSLEHFSIGSARIPKAVYHAYMYVKKAVRPTYRKESGMEGRTNRIDSVLRGIEEHVGRWQEESQVREAEADREALWAKAVEREKLLAETKESEESRQRPRERSAGSRGPCLSFTPGRPRKLWRG
jgi:hypothetical protein